MPQASVKLKPPSHYAVLFIAFRVQASSTSDFLNKSVTEHVLTSLMRQHMHRYELALEITRYIARLTLALDLVAYGL